MGGADMKTIAVVCENGGTGKSVIANELYESYVRQGVRASLYSLDGHYKDASSAKKADDAEGAVVDTPGVLTDNLKDIISGADVVTIPVWPMPMGGTYKKALESSVADLANISWTAGAGACTAATFLAAFAPKCPWAHLDVAGTAQAAGGAFGAFAPSGQKGIM